MTLQPEDLPVRRHVPDLDSVLRAARGEPAAVGAKRQVHVGVWDGLSGEVAEALSRDGIPELHGLVIARRGQEPTVVGAERHAQYLVLVAAQGYEPGG